MKRERRAGTAVAAGAALAALALPAPAQRAGVLEQLPPGAPPALQACVGCHGAQGAGNPESGAPRIAGQSQAYLRKQLESFADGTRRSRVMEPIARGLPPEVRAQVARHYAQSIARAPPRGEDGEPPARGRELATRGDNDLGVQACRNCHGPGGVGEPPNIPYLAGLDADYIEHELRAWKEGTRTNDAGQQMFTVVTALPEADMAAVARYYASLPPPEPAPTNLVRARPPARPMLQVQRDAPGGAGAAPAPPGRDAEAAAIDTGEEAPGRERAPPQGRSGTGAEGSGGEERVGAGQGQATTGGTQGQGGGEASTLEGRGAPAPGAPARRAGEAEQAPRWPAVINDGEPGAPQSFAPAPPGDPQRGRAIVASGAYGCPACHAIPGIAWPRGIVGPPLENFGNRALIAGRLPNDAPTLAAFVFNAPALVPDTGMPKLGLSFEEARDVAAYLRTLGAPGDG